MPSSLRRFFTLALALAALTACSNTETLGNRAEAGSSLGNRDAPFIQPGDGGTSDVAPSPFCKAITQACASNAECCSEICDPSSATCVASINTCTATSGACMTSTECCTMSCTAGRCSAAACVADGQACVDPAACCGGNCSGGLCQPLNTACSTAGNPCSANPQCCSQLCEAGVCKLGSSFCIQSGDVCSDSSTCCSGDCQIATGSTLGTCAPPPSGATNCSDGVDGTVCGDCNKCCSRLCAPYGPTGVKVCQPASGCRVNGDLCRKDSDCCGAAGTGLPGDGNVTCEIDPGKTLGICRNPRSCDPQGNVCHYKKEGYACSGSSSRNNCCACISGKECCQLDFMGVPRCNALETCRAAGETCSSAMDCCNQLPCIPDGTGLLRCYLPPSSTLDGGVPSTCVPSGGPCTINADCCVGVACIAPQGSTQGICGLPTPPGIPDAGAGDASGPTPTCAQYGQQCTASADCCNAIPCTNGRCVTEFNIP